MSFRDINTSGVSENLHNPGRITDNLIVIDINNHNYFTGA